MFKIKCTNKYGGQIIRDIHKMIKNGYLTKNQVCINDGKCMYKDFGYICHEYVLFPKRFYVDVYKFVDAGKWVAE